VPTISVFYGLVIRMFYDEHGPPHFHVAYQGYQAVIEIRTLDVKMGNLPRRELNLALEWAELHRDELLANWRLIEEGLPFKRILPLE
jgi:hypothetical protein